MPPRLRLVPTTPPAVQGFTTAGKAVNSLPISRATRGPLLTPTGWVVIVFVATTIAGTFGALLVLKLTGGI